MEGADGLEALVGLEVLQLETVDLAMGGKGRHGCRRLGIKASVGTRIRVCRIWESRVWETYGGNFWESGDGERVREIGRAHV